MSVRCACRYTLSVTVVRTNSDFLTIPLSRNFSHVLSNCSFFHVYCSWDFTNIYAVIAELKFLPILHFRLIQHIFTYVCNYLRIIEFFFFNSELM